MKKARLNCICLLFITIFISLASCHINHYVNGEGNKRVSYPSNMWKCLVAESASEGYRGMKTVALVYRNRLERGMRLGCSGLKRRNLNAFIKKEGRRKEILAKRVVKEVFEENCKDFTGGATHYENLESFPTPKWAKDMIIIRKEGKHTLYKEK